MSAPRLPLPAGACDCHVHVVGGAARYPMVAQRHYTPAAAPHEALLSHLQGIGLQRSVIVQPSFYGSDNRCLLDSLARLQGAGRGVAVLDDGADDELLAQLRACGVRGLRVDVESTGVRDAGVVEGSLRRWADRLAPLGWHLQLYAAHTTVAQLAPVLRALAVPVVLDHFALVPAAAAADDAARQCILGLCAQVMRTSSCRHPIGSPRGGPWRLSSTWGERSSTPIRTGCCGAATGAHRPRAGQVGARGQPLPRHRAGNAGGVDRALAAQRVVAPTGPGRQPVATV